MQEAIRIDKWLWFARFFKNRTVSSKMVLAGKVRLNGRRISKPSTLLKKGDGLTFSQGDTLRLIKVLELGSRRGPVREAILLYEEVEDRIHIGRVVYSGEIHINNLNLDLSSRPNKRQKSDILNLKNSY